MKRFYILSFALLFISEAVVARESTQPPSVALRNEISYVCEAMLESKKLNNDLWQLEFKLIKDIHNTSAHTITLNVKKEVFDNLAIDQNYIISYHTHRKTKVDGLKTYLPLDGGAILAKVQGADPAVFRYNKHLLKQLKSDPESIIKNPKSLIGSLMTGMQTEDPKIQEFFVRELVNWRGLINNLTPLDASRLLDIYNDPDISEGSLIAFLEIRPEFHQLLGTKALYPKVMGLLGSVPVNLDPSSDTPDLIFTALNFLIHHDLGNWDIYSRWLLCNNPSITEKALNKLHQLNPDKTIQLVSSRLNTTLLNDASRRVLNRYNRKHNKVD